MVSDIKDKAARATTFTKETIEKLFPEPAPKRWVLAPLWAAVLMGGCILTTGIVIGRVTARS